MYVILDGAARVWRKTKLDRKAARAPEAPPVPAAGMWRTRVLRMENGGMVQSVEREMWSDGTRARWHVAMQVNSVVCKAGGALAQHGATEMPSRSLRCLV